jgi:sugar/nucleoside kinase (ribokinase family)
MKSVSRPKVFGAGLIALDLVMGIEPVSAVRSWAGGTCGNVMSILAYLGWDAYPVARMNGDPASRRVQADMAHWGVHLDFTNCTPTIQTPIIIQEIRRGHDGVPTHRFSWSCPQCGQWLPSFKSITLEAVKAVEPTLPGTSVFFLDRLSRATLILASRASALGAAVIFEPSGKTDQKLFAEAMRIAHVVKYADQRLAEVGDGLQANATPLVEIQTLGARGLKFRHRFGSILSEWSHLAAVPAPRLADTCGSGDWCTAGLIARAASGGYAGLLRAGVTGVRAALHYGQVLAAWNCGFEGARGGMYAVDRESFGEQIDALATGRLDATTLNITQEIRSTFVACPACATEPEHSIKQLNISQSNGARRRHGPYV